MSAEYLPKSAALVAKIKALNDARRVWHERALNLFRRAAWLSQFARMVPGAFSARAKAALRAEEARAARAEAARFAAQIEAL